GDGNRRQWQRTIDKSVQRDETFDAAVQKKMRIRFKERRVVAVSDRKEEEIFLPQVLFYTADDGRAVEVTNLLGDHPDHIGAFYSQVAGVEARPVIQVASGSENSLLSVGRNGPRGSRFVQHRRTGTLGKTHALGHHFEGNLKPFLTIPLVFRGFHSAIAPSQK